MDKASREVGLVYGWKDEVDDSTSEVRPRIRHTFEGDFSEHLLSLNHLGATTDIMVRKSIALEIDGFDERLRKGEDLLFMAQAARAVPHSCRTPGHYEQSHWARTCADDRLRG